MNKTFLIIRREYLSRVLKRSFILMTILTPVIFAGIYAIGIYFMLKPGEEKVIRVHDQSGLFENKFPNTSSITFEYTSSDIEESKNAVKDGTFSGALWIPDLDLKNPEGIILYSSEALGIGIESSIKRTIKNEIENIKLDSAGIDKSVLDSIKTKVSLQAINLSGDEEKESNSALASGIGMFSGFLIYIFLFIYGAQVMRGVMEEKTSRVVEIIISSVKPMQLMTGKILGIAAVGLTQFTIWVVLTVFLWTAVTPLVVGDTLNKEQMAKIENVQAGSNPNESAEMIANINSAINKMNIPLILGLFVFYFLGGYLFYAAFFAMVGAAVDSEADSQQFMLPIMMPIIFAFIMYGAVINDPNGSVAFWLSMIPFTSPIIMMIRVPFEIPGWQIALSMLLMIGGFIFTTWMAGRVYRVGILMHGTKVNYKTLAKWFMMKN